MIPKCDNCTELMSALREALRQRDEARAGEAKAFDLLVSGEALRDRMKLESILTMDKDKARLLYLLTGEKR